jgi:hypothetical protein
VAASGGLGHGAGPKAVQLKRGDPASYCRQGMKERLPFYPVRRYGLASLFAEVRDPLAQH